jgi:hypothetical protein
LFQAGGSSSGSGGKPAGMAALAANYKSAGNLIIPSILAKPSSSQSNFHCFTISNAVKENATTLVLLAVNLNLQGQC